MIKKFISELFPIIVQIGTILSLLKPRILKLKSGICQYDILFIVNLFNPQISNGY